MISCVSGAIQATSASIPSGPKAIIAPRKRDLLSALLWTTAAIGYVAQFAPLIWPIDLRSDGAIYSFVTWMLSFCQTFRFHLGLVGIPALLLALIARRWRPLVGLAPVVAYGLWPGLAPMWRAAPPAAQGESLCVMSANVLRGNRHVDEVLAQVRAVDPDVLFIQEYSPHWRSSISDELRERYPYRLEADREDNFGVAAFSRKPMLRSEVVFLGAGRRPCLRCEFELNKQNVAFYNVHVVPPTGFGWSIEQRRAYADLLERVKSERIPVILAGDFNATTDSCVDARLRELGFLNAHELAGKGRGATWPELTIFAKLPGIRLDHVYLDRHLTATESVIGPRIGSDHRPIYARIQFR